MPVFQNKFQGQSITCLNVGYPETILVGDDIEFIYTGGIFPYQDRNAIPRTYWSQKLAKELKPSSIDVSFHGKIQGEYDSLVSYLPKSS